MYTSSRNNEPLLAEEIQDAVSPIGQAANPCTSNPIDSCLCIVFPSPTAYSDNPSFFCPSPAASLTVSFALPAASDALPPTSPAVSDVLSPASPAVSAAFSPASPAVSTAESAAPFAESAAPSTPSPPSFVSADVNGAAAVCPVPEATLPSPPATPLTVSLRPPPRVPTYEVHTYVSHGCCLRNV